MLQQMPILLQTAHDQFCTTYRMTVETHNIVTKVKPEEVVTSRYLLSYMYIVLGYSATQILGIRHETAFPMVLLYRKGGDLLLALTKVLCKKCSQTCKSTQEPNTSYGHGQCILENGSEVVWEEMTHTLHAQFRLILDAYSKPYDITSSESQSTLW